MSTFIHEIQAYELLAKAGLHAPRHGVICTREDLAKLPFQAGEGVVLKGTALDVWHKSDLGLVRFVDFDPEVLWKHHQEMEAIASREGTWIGTLVCEKVAFKKVSGLPTEALAALRKSPEAGWTVLLGLGGLHTNAWGEEIKPLIWPVELATPEQALEEFKAHWLGRIWLGNLRQGEAQTEEGKLKGFFQGLWKLADLLEDLGATLLEMNPMVLSPEGWPVPLDGVGSSEEKTPAAPHALEAAKLLDVLVRPKRIGIIGVSSKPGTPGRMILENLLRSSLPKESFVPIKPGEKELLGLPCLENVEALKDHPVDILILSLPAPLTIQAIEQLCAQGGGAQVLYLVPGGIGDGADTEGRGKYVIDLIESRRREGKWAPALIGPNGLGFLSAEGRLNSLFIPEFKLPFMPEGGTLSLVSQSGAFLITRLSTAPTLPLRYGCSIGNQIDIRLSDFIRALTEDEGTQVIATYVEGFQPGDTLAVARAAKAAGAKGKRVVMYKGGRSQAGQKAASSHTGALAGDWELQRAVLRRAGVVVCESMGEYDAVLQWLSAHPEGRPREIAIMTNAGYESVVAADLLEGVLVPHTATSEEEQELEAMIQAHGLTGLVAPHMPLDLTPMADEKAYLESARILAKGASDTVILGLVPLTRRLETFDEAGMKAFADEIAALAQQSGKRVGAVVEAGPIFEPYRQALLKAGLPVFTSMERALRGLLALV